jgi:hypothetical protein
LPSESRRANSEIAASVLLNRQVGRVEVDDAVSNSTLLVRAVERE